MGKMQGKAPPTGGGAGGDVLRRSLAARIDQATGLTILDAVAWAEGSARHLRICLGTGAAARGVTPGPGLTLDPAPRAVGQSLLIAATDAGAPGDPVTLTLDGGAALALTPDAADTGLLAGHHAALAFRLAETPETVADWARWHGDEHGMTGALVVNRAAPDGGAFADALAALPGLPRIVVVDCPLPLGQPDTGPETHPFLAPDAPGKDRMQRPAPDQWLSPIGQSLIWEALRWRFLSRAETVLTLDVCDLLAPAAGPATGPGAFAQTAAAPAGVTLLAGRRIYPWRIRPGQPARFADHICRQFDARRGIARWGVAPARVGPDQTWRGTRIAYARPDPGQIIPFWRAMALRVPGRKTSELAPKTSLVEDPALLDLAIRRFGHRPVLPRVSDFDDRPVDPATARTAIVTTMKNEGPFILEWLAHHRAIGVTDVLIYTNDCTDGTDTLLDILAARGIVEHRANPFREMGLRPQHAALQAAEGEAVLARADWAICMDVDEFINIKLGDGRLPALYAAMESALPGANMAALTWRLFGNADIHAFADRFLTDQFTLAAPEVVRKPHQAWGFKTLFRTIDLYKKLGVHRPKGLRPDLWDQVRWLNGSGRPMPRDMFRNGWRSTTETFGYDWVQLNHYAVRSAESFLVKRDRGRVNHVDRDQGLNYWFRMNFNMIRDHSIQRMIPPARAEYDRLLADPAIRAAHDACVAAHRAKITELRARPEQAAFYAELTGPRLQALSRLLHHFGSSVFNAGPGCIPHDLHDRPLPPDFYFTLGEAAEAEAEADEGTGSDG
jgi:hypothetical protein